MRILASLGVALGLAMPAGANGPEDLPPAESDAVLVATVFGPVLVTPSVPEGHYGERYADGAYWLPGVTDGSSLVRKVIEAARASRRRGERIQLATTLRGGQRVWLSETPPFPGVFRLPAGERFAWIAGVTRPDPQQQVALDAAIRLAAPVESDPPAVSTSRN
jgi:hypothetical protein